MFCFLRRGWKRSEWTVISNANLPLLEFKQINCPILLLLLIQCIIVLLCAFVQVGATLTLWAQNVDLTLKQCQLVILWYHYSLNVILILNEHFLLAWKILEKLSDPVSLSRISEAWECFSVCTVGSKIIWHPWISPKGQRILC